jgi:hypothetical protein
MLFELETTRRVTIFICILCTERLQAALTRKYLIINQRIHLAVYLEKYLNSPKLSNLVDGRVDLTNAVDVPTIANVSSRKPGHYDVSAPYANKNIISIPLVFVYKTKSSKPAPPPPFLLSS